MPSFGKHSLANAARGAMFVLACTTALCGPANRSFAEDVRVDPFQPSSNADEERKVEDRDRMKSLIREMLPEIKAKVMEDMEAQKAFTVDEARKAAIEAMRADPSMSNRNMVADVSGALGVAGGAVKSALGMEPTKLPDGAKFIACVDGKALYKDTKENVNFFRDFAPGVMTPCMTGKLSAESPKTEAPAPTPSVAGMPVPANASAPKAPTAPSPPPLIPGRPAAPVAPPRPPVPGGAPKMSGIVRPIQPMASGHSQAGQNVAMSPSGT